MDMEERDAKMLYDRAGEKVRGRFAAVRWPHLALEAANLERLVEGVLGARLNCVLTAFGDEFDEDTEGTRVEEAWRTDALQARYAPEGVFVRAAFTVRVTVIDDDEEENGTPLADETLEIAAEICLSFIEKKHTSPFVDFMSGIVRRVSDGAAKTIDAFAMPIEPAAALAWGLNGAEPPAEE